MSKRIELENGCYKKIYYYDSGETKIKYEYYFNSKNEFNRADGPAIIWYHKSGEIESEDYVINNKYHRLNGPAKIWYRENGEIGSEQYQINNKYHRLNGPAKIWYFKSGEIRDEHYYINDIIYSKEEFYKKINIDRNLKLLNKK